MRTLYNVSIPFPDSSKEETQETDEDTENTHQKTQTWIPEVNELFSNTVTVKPIC